MMARVVSDGISHGTRVELADGSTLYGVTDLHWRVAVDDIAKLEVTMCFCSIDVSGELKVFAEHPVTGDMLQLAGMTFVNGDAWVAP